MITTTFLIALVAIVAIFDLIIYWKQGLEATITMHVRNASLQHPIIPFALGVVCGHLFWF